MACKDVGSTNSDIAGLGILLSFIIQGGLSFLLSLCTVFIDWRLEGFQGMWADYWSHSGGTFSSGRNDQQLAIAQQVSNRSIVLSGKAQNHLRSMRDLINRLLGTISDAQTLNAMVVVSRDPSASLFRVLLVNIFGMLYLVFIAIFGVRLHSWNDNIVGACYHTRLLSISSSNHPLADEIYLAITSLYFFTALTLSTEPQLQQVVKNLDSLRGKSQGQQSKSWDMMITLISTFVAGTSPPFSKLYWARIFRVVSIVESYGPMKVNPLIERTRQLLAEQTRHIMDLIRHRMDPLLNRTHSEDSASSRGQLFLAYLWKWVVAYGALLVVLITVSQNNAYTILLLAILQCPVHGYMLFALRASNESQLSGDSENQWGFGQIVPLVLFISVATDFIQAVVEYKITTRDESSEFWKLLGSILANGETGTSEGNRNLDLMRGNEAVNHGTSSVLSQE
ncbi:hypothetical protein N8I77_013679 [Diaporthe amygdali]|uniref:Uncharacterized protein n=1 Tax=Phomopsis amygdali TaxID=1214568 RepID=A0AAD9S0S3_PHOAM|nr:hypothetical protein N8I77_013679 [Diaporthe amygdali]